MAWSKALQQCLHLPSRIALLLGVGAFPAAGAHSNAVVAQGHASANEDVQIRVLGGELFFAEKGGEFRRIELGDSAESRALMRSLGSKGASSAGGKARAIMLAGSGGAGFHWAPVHKNGRNRDSTAPAPAQRSAAPNSTHPQRQKKPPKTTLLGGERTG